MNGDLGAQRWENNSKSYQLILDLKMKYFLVPRLGNKKKKYNTELINICKYMACANILHLIKVTNKPKKISKIPNYGNQNWADVCASESTVHELHGQLIPIVAGANFPLQDFSFQN